MRNQNQVNVALICSSSLTQGGSFSYEAEALRQITSLRSLNTRFVLYLPKGCSNPTGISAKTLPVEKYKSNLLSLFLLSLRRTLPGYKFLKFLKLRHGSLERSFFRNGVHLAYFLSPNALSLDIVDMPIISTVWDLGHRDLPEFQEFTGDRHYEERELYYQQILPKSFRVFVDTQYTSDRIQSCYGVLENRIIIGGLSARLLETDLATSKLSGEYILYPAQFWPHKRHILLLNAFKIVLETLPNYRLILTGSDKGNLEYIRRSAYSLGVLDQIDFVGFVSECELGNLMKNASCIVFPSQLGPSNLPPLEAAKLGTPSLISNVHVDKNLDNPLIETVQYQNPSSWAQKIVEVLTRKKIPSININSESDQISLGFSSALDDFIQIRFEWNPESDGPYSRKN